MVLTKVAEVAVAMGRKFIPSPRLVCMEYPLMVDTGGGGGGEIVFITFPDMVR
jgi:hypothetical protein